MAAAGDFRPVLAEEAGVTAEPAVTIVTPGVAEEGEEEKEAAKDSEEAVTTIRESA